jgi:hypothetical protein
VQTVGPDTDVNADSMDHLSEPDQDETPHGSEKMDEDRLFSLFGSTRNTPEGEEPDDLDICRGSRGSGSPVPEAETEHTIGAGHDYTAEIDDMSICTSERGSEVAPESAYDHSRSAAGEPQTAGQFRPYITSAVENAPWREKNAFEDVYPPEIVQRSALLPPEVAPSSALPQVVDGMFISTQNVPTSDIMETNALLRGIYRRLTQMLDIQQRETIESEKFREFVGSRNGSDLDLNVVQ